MEEKKIPEENFNEETANENISQQETIEQPVAENTKFETENMEVHHHPHVEKKNFKEYLLEGLMIFIAVTMGFFSENVREHLVNNEKEQEYMESMVQDLTRDTAIISEVSARHERIYNKIDSALKIPVEQLTNVNAQDSFYHFFVFFYSWVDAFHRIDNTLAQLKNAGGFSLIRDKQVKDSITELNSFYERVLELDKNFYIGRWQRLDEFAMQLMILPRPPSGLHDSLYEVYPQHINFITRYDVAMWHQLYSFARFEQSDIEVNLLDEKKYKLKAANLIALIKKNYNIDND